MARNHIFLAANGRSLMRAAKENGEWVVSKSLNDIKINSIEKSPVNPDEVYLGTQERGVMVSYDAGLSWQSVGLEDIPVKSMAIDPQDPRVLYAGGKPVSLYQSRDSGETWIELDALRATRRWWWFSPADPPGTTPYVSGLAVSPSDPKVILAGIEAGAVMRSEDGGQSWTKHLPGSDRDCHSLKFHRTNGDWVYEGGGFGVAFSQDGGRKWHRPKKGLGSKYGWMVAADSAQPDIWYLSASEMPNLLKGEFTPPGHHDGDARAHIYRKRGDAPWEQLAGGLPDPLDYMAYGLVTLPGVPGLVYAGLANGKIWQSSNYGESWVKLPIDLGGIHSAFCVI